MSWDASYYRLSTTGSVSAYYSPGIAHTYGSPGARGRDELLAMPYFTGHGGTINGAIIHCLQDSVAIRVGLYARRTGDQYPGARFADLGSWALQNAVTTVSFATVVTTPHDLLWVVVNVNSNALMRGEVDPGQSQHAPIYGTPNTTLGIQNECLITSYGYSQSVPASFPTSATVGAYGGIKLGFSYATGMPTQTTGMQDNLDWRQVSSVGTGVISEVASKVHLAGLRAQSPAGFVSRNLNPSLAWAVPYFTGNSETVVALGVQATETASLVSLGLYTVASAGMPLPYEQIATATVSAGGTWAPGSVTIVHLAADTMYWLVARAVSSVNVSAMGGATATYAPALFGWDPASLSLPMGAAVASYAAALPAVFPASWTAVATTLPNLGLVLS